MQGVRGTFALLSLLFMATQAQADTIIQFPFWDDDNTTIEESMLFESGGLSVAVTAWTASYNSEGEQLEAWQQVMGEGLGVFRDSEGLSVKSSDDDGAYMDGGSSSDYASDPDEGLLFVFSEAVTWFDVFVTDWQSNDDINFSAVALNDDGGFSLLSSLIDVPDQSGRSYGAYEFAQTFRSNAFLIWVDGNNDDIAVAGTAVIPEPATAALALGLVCCLFRQRKYR